MNYFAFAQISSCLEFKHLFYICTLFRIFNLNSLFSKLRHYLCIFELKLRISHFISSLVVLYSLSYQPLQNSISFILRHHYSDIFSYLIHIRLCPVILVRIDSFNFYDIPIFSNNPMSIPKGYSKVLKFLFKAIMYRNSSSANSIYFQHNHIIYF